MKHLAFIMDGNRRWAQKQGYKLVTDGYNSGAAVIESLIKFCCEKKIPHLTLYVFSLENLQRNLEEKDFLFDAIIRYGKEKKDQFFENSIQLRLVGDESYFPPGVLDLKKQLEEQVVLNPVLSVHLLFCYGGQQEIVAAAQAIAKAVDVKLLALEDITPDLFASYTWMGTIPSPDLIIRTGGYHRLSNFLAYQSAYSHIAFFDCLWPELTIQMVEEEINAWKQVKKNCGK